MAGKVSKYRHISFKANFAKCIDIIVNHLAKDPPSIYIIFMPIISQANAEEAIKAFEAIDAILSHTESRAFDLKLEAA